MSHPPHCRALPADARVLVYDEKQRPLLWLAGQRLHISDTGSVKLSGDLLTSVAAFCRSGGVAADCIAEDIRAEVLRLMEPIRTTRREPDVRL